MFLPSIAKRVQGPVDTLCESSHFGFLFFDSLSPFPLSSFHLRWFLGNLLLDTLILYHRESIAAVGDCSLPLANSGVSCRVWAEITKRSVASIHCAQCP